MTALALLTLVRATVIMTIAATATLLLGRRASASARHLVWMVAVVAVLVLPAMSIVLPSWGVHIPVTAKPTSHSSTMHETTVSQTRTPSIVPVDSLLPSVSAPASPIDWKIVALLLYLAGIAVLATRLAAAQLALHRLARGCATVSDPEWLALLAECKRNLCLVRPVRLLRSLDQTMPMAFGVWRPTILVPSVADTWTHDRRRAVLLHEFAHIGRRDCLTHLLTSIMCAVYWIHPGAWWIARRLRVERELACDDRVISIGTSARDYAQHLLELAYGLGGFKASALVVTMARPKQLEGRLLAALDEARNRTTPSFRSRLIGFVAAVAVIVPLAAAEATFVPVTAVVAEKSAAPAEQLRRLTPPRENRLPGTWSIRQSIDSKQVHLQLQENRNSNSGFTIAISELQGLSPLLMTGGGPVQFNIRRDAGTIVFEGTFRAGVGAGTYTFEPNAAFSAELAKRGVGQPSTDELYVLAKANIGVAYLDELNTQKYARPILPQLIQAGNHGVDLEYLRGMARAGYRLGQIDGLIKTRDHGVDPEFIQGLADHGLKGLSVDELVRARDHGVDPEFAGGMKDLGYPMQSLVELVEARDHGVDPEFVGAMSGLGFRNLPLAQLIRARDHGVDPEYVGALRKLGYQLTLDELVNTRDHGVDDEFISGFIGLGYRNLSAAELIRLRDHGVTAEWARSRNARLRSPMTIDELVRTRDRGGE